MDETHPPNRPPQNLRTPSPPKNPPEITPKYRESLMSLSLFHGFSEFQTFLSTVGVKREAYLHLSEQGLVQKETTTIKDLPKEVPDPFFQLLCHQFCDSKTLAGMHTYCYVSLLLSPKVKSKAFMFWCVVLSSQSWVVYKS
ncbi:hypothetical protein HAX54_028335 [Datura stramonium]|uniref:Uncharacterized protein n=1 Tax=Datura stramonium TaxID=4076 RepID=A0ABS8S9I7_DATST|nr:hypothetical protein [Datura stramonium]